MPTIQDHNKDLQRMIDALEQMVAVEDAAYHCPDCGVGELCPKHDDAFWEFWGQVKGLLRRKK